MSQFNITVDGGTSVRLPTAGKYVDRDIIVTATGSNVIPENLDDVLTEQEQLLEQLTIALENKASGDGGEMVEQLLQRTIEEYSNHEITKLGDYAFTNCTKLKTVEIPNVTTMGLNAFQNTNISVAEFPNLVNAANFCFANCTNLKTVRLPSLQKGGNYLFSVSRVLERIDLLSVGSVGTSCFNACYVLTTLILRSPTLLSLANTNVFANCHHIHGTKNNTYNPQGLKDGYIYVPKALLSDEDETKDYRRATNWTTFASQFRAIEDYPEICGG